MRCRGGFVKRFGLSGSSDNNGMGGVEWVWSI